VQRGFGGRDLLRLACQPGLLVQRTRSSLLPGSNLGGLSELFLGHVERVAQRLLAPGGFTEFGSLGCDYPRTPLFHRVIDGLRGSRIVADAGPAREGVHFIGQAVLRVVQLAFQITGPLGEHVDVVGESLGAEKRLQQ